MRYGKILNKLGPAVVIFIAAGISSLALFTPIAGAIPHHTPPLPKKELQIALAINWNSKNIPQNLHQIPHTSSAWQFTSHQSTCSPISSQPLIINSSSAGYYYKTNMISSQVTMLRTSANSTAAMAGIPQYASSSQCVLNDIGIVWGYAKTLIYPRPSQCTYSGWNITQLAQKIIQTPTKTRYVYTGTAQCTTPPPKNQPTNSPYYLRDIQTIRKIGNTIIIGHLMQYHKTNSIPQPTIPLDKLMNTMQQRITHHHG